MGTDSPGAALVQNLLKALEFTPRPTRLIRGVSGVDHPVLGTGFDDRRTRLGIILSEDDPRAAAFVQSDVQAAVPDVNVIVGRIVVDNADYEILKELASDATDGKDRLDVRRIPITKLRKLEAAMIRHLAFSELNSRPLAFLSPSAVEIDDRTVGICPVPIKSFTEEEIDLFIRGTDMEQLRIALRRVDIFQYFFPAPDQCVLGLVERQQVTTSTLMEQLEYIPRIGHPYGECEITKTKSRDLGHIVSELSERHLIVEGETSLEISPKGEVYRHKVKFKPRENVLSKLLNRISVHLDLSKLLSTFK